MMNDKNLGSQKNKLKEIKRTPELRFKGFSDDWEQRKLSDLMTFSNGINAPKENYGTGTKMISVMDILNPLPMKYDNILNSVAVDKKIEDKNKVEKGDLIFVRSSEIVEEVGWAKAYKEDHYALYSGFAIRGKRISSYNAYFIELTLNYANRKEIKRRAGGSTRFNVSQEILNSLNVLTPSISEQNQIDLFFTKIDDTITLHQRKLDKLKQLKQGYLQQLFPKPGETVPKIRFANFEGEWEERKLKQLGEIQTGNTPSTKDSSNYAKNGILWVTPTDIDSLIISDTAKKLSEKGQTKARIAKAGSILVTSIASIGKNALAKTDMGFNQQINSLTPSSENDSYFLLTQSEKWSEMMQRNAAAGTMQIVNKSEFSNIVTEVPKLDEQGQIGNFFAKLDQTITLQLSKINKLKSIKQALLQKMFI
ncbi:restriction endonuclease subunit S [Lactococcus garvieae]|uniref:restriction endonuclease subunit S n=3 Tax=Streptococcaceae TaxID=1300 RepID=UPI00051FC4DF|nr:restriction endonuclease subunit S [Lactococcus garvieae]CEF52102.1 Type I restriction modification DNA specificity domain protein [Lactococcus garvieae]